MRSIIMRSLAFGGLAVVASACRPDELGYLLFGQIAGIF